MKVIQLILAEKHTGNKIKVRLKKEDKKLMLKILKQNFKVAHEKEIKYGSK